MPRTCDFHARARVMDIQKDSMENYKDAQESSTEVCTGDYGKDLLVGISKGSSWDPMGI